MCAQSSAQGNPVTEHWAGWRDELVAGTVGQVDESESCGKRQSWKEGTMG